MNWTTTADLRLQVMKWWERGELLSGLVTGESIFPRRLTLREPTSSEMTDRFDEVRCWIGGLRQAHYCRIEMREFKHRVFGKNSVPSDVWIDSLDDALAFIGKRRDASRFVKLLEITRDREPSLLAWVGKKPRRALELCDNWERLLSIVAWLREHPRPEIYLRQVDVAGIDSKFIEMHRGVLSELLDLVLPPELIDKSVSGASQFVRRYGFREKPLRIRFRILDPKRQVVDAGDEQDVTLDRDSFSRLNLDIARVFITENEINFLSFGEMEDSIAVFGGGYSIDELAPAQWLRNCQMYYWGDIDTHGFAILSAARSHFPHIQSLLMDEQTLLNFRQLWGAEESQHSCQELPNLIPEEQNVYRNLQRQTWRQNVRLEQERIAWGYAWNTIIQTLISEDTRSFQQC